MPHLSTNSFGPPIWATLHLLAAAYEPERASDYYQLFKTVARLLPCPECQQHTRAMLNDSTFYHAGVFQNRTTMERFVYDMHRRVAERIHDGTQSIPSFEEVQAKYRACCVNDARQDCEKGCAVDTAPHCRVVFEQK